MTQIVNHNSDSSTPLRVLWLCGFPRSLLDKLPEDLNLFSSHDWSWIVGHLPPPNSVDLHVACPVDGITSPQTHSIRGAHFHLFPRPRKAALRLYRSWIKPYAKIVEEINPDILHGWGTESGFGSTALRINSRIAVVSVQGILADYLKYLPFFHPSVILSLINEHRVLKKSPFLLAEGEYARQAAESHSSAIVRIIPHPLRNCFLCAESNGDAFQKTALFVGSLGKGKGILDAVKAWNVVPGEWRLLIAGTGREEHKAKKLAYSHSISNRIDFIGHKSSEEICDLLKTCPIFLLPSYLDTGPTALKEALAMGSWPIVYDNSGPSELVEKYQYGSRVLTGNVDNLGSTILRVISNEPWANSQHRNSCMQKIRYDLSPKVAWTKLLTAYREFLTNT